MRISDCSADVCSSDLEAWSPAPEYLLFAVISDSPDDFIWLEITLALVIAADIGVARRRGGRQAQRFGRGGEAARSEEHTSELQSLMGISYAVFCLKKKKRLHIRTDESQLKITKKKPLKYTVS